MHISELKVAEPYKSLFRIDDKIVTAIQENMEEKGYDQSQPVTVWRVHNIVIDGHTRLQAARTLGLEDIPVVERFFADEEAALKYAIHNQRNRRHLTDAHILFLVEKLDKLFDRGGDRRSNFGNPNIEKLQDSRKITADSIGISADKVSQCRHIRDNCTKREIEQINNGEKRIHQVYESSLTAKKREKKKQAEQDKILEIIQEVKLKDYPGKLSSEFIKKHDDLFQNLLPALCKRTEEVYRIREAVAFFASKDEATFGIFRERLPIQRFLGSLYVRDFIAMLQCFGYTIEKPSDLKVIEEKRVVPVKKKRLAPLLQNSAARFNEIGFVSNAEHEEMDRKMANAAERDMRKSGD